MSSASARKIATLRSHMSIIRENSSTGEYESPTSYCMRNCGQSDAIMTSAKRSTAIMDAMSTVGLSRGNDEDEGDDDDELDGFVVPDSVTASTAVFLEDAEDLSGFALVVCLTSADAVADEVSEDSGDGEDSEDSESCEDCVRCDLRLASARKTEVFSNMASKALRHR